MQRLRRLCFALLVLAGAVLPAIRWIGREDGPYDRDYAALHAFLDDVASRTHAGETVALVVPPSYMRDGLLAYRAAYLLPGRHVTVATPPAPIHADAVAAWRVHPTLPGRVATPLRDGQLFR